MVVIVYRAWWDFANVLMVMTGIDVSMRLHFVITDRVEAMAFANWRRIISCVFVMRDGMALCAIITLMIVTRILVEMVGPVWIKSIVSPVYVPTNGEVMCVKYLGRLVMMLCVRDMVLAWIRPMKNGRRMNTSVNVRQIHAAER
jgi:hypothetical protein